MSLRVAPAKFLILLKKLKGDVKSLREKNDRAEKRIKEIKRAEPVEYGSKIVNENRTGVFKTCRSTTWKYEFSTEFKISSVEISCTVDTNNRLIFITPLGRVLGGDNLTNGSMALR